jgi:hypothetical protein
MNCHTDQQQRERKSRDPASRSGLTSTGPTSGFSPQRTPFAVPRNTWCYRRCKSAEKWRRKLVSSRFRLPWSQNSFVTQAHFSLWVGSRVCFARPWADPQDIFRARFFPDTTFTRKPTAVHTPRTSVPSRRPQPLRWLSADLHLAFSSSANACRLGTTCHRRIGQGWLGFACAISQAPVVGGPHKTHIA